MFRMAIRVVRLSGDELRLNVDETDTVAHIRTLCAADHPGLYSRLFLNERELFDFETVAEIGRSAVLTSILQESHFTLTSSTDGKVKLFDEGGRCLRTLLEYPQGVEHAGFLDSSRAYAVSGDGAISIFSLEGDSCVTVRKRSARRVYSAVLAPDGVHLVVACDSTALLLNVESGTTRNFLGHRGAVLSARLSPDGMSVLTACADHKARLFAITTGSCEKTLKGHLGEVRSAEFSPDGLRVVTASSDGSAKLFCMTSGICIRTLDHPCAVVAGSFSPDGTWVLTASQNDAPRLFNADSGRLGLCGVV